MLNKKGSGWMFFFFSVFMLLMGTALMYELFKEKQDTSMRIGDVQNAALELYFKSDLLRGDLNENVRLLAEESLLEINENGGFGKANNCGRMDNLVVWDYDKCWPDVEKNFLLLFEKKMKEWGIKYEKVELTEGELVVNFGLQFFEEKLKDAELEYEREIIVHEKVEFDFNNIKELKRKILDARSTGDYTGLGKVEEGYISFRIENDKSGLEFNMGRGFGVKKLVFQFAIREPF